MVGVQAGDHIPVGLLLAALPSRQQAKTQGRRHACSGLAHCLLLTSWMAEVSHGPAPPEGQKGGPRLFCLLAKAPRKAPEWPWRGLPERTLSFTGWGFRGSRLRSVLAGSAPPPI